MAEADSAVESIRTDLDRVGDKILQAQEAINAFAKNIMQEYRKKIINSQKNIGELVLEHGYAILDQEEKWREAVAESAKTEEERIKVLETAIDTESNLIEVQKQRVLQEEDLKRIGQATLAAYNSISQSIIEIKRREAEEKKALIDKELEYTVSALEKERQEKLIAAGFAVENNAKSLEAQLEAARNSGDEALAYELEKRIQEKEINDEYDRLIEEANKEAAKEKAKLEYEVAKQEHALKLVNAVNAGALAILNSLKVGFPLGPILAGLTGVATAVQIAAIKKNSPKMPTFSTGGIVPGSFYSGDKVLSALNSREGVFTLEDQKYLFDQIQGRNLDSGTVNTTIVVMLDRKEIARSTIELVNDGFYTIKARAIR